ncbi:unnamed protein product [Larinioides sclopetarius]
MLEKLVVYRGERDFMCIGYEKERLKNLEAFYATMDSYAQQYRNKFYKIKMDEKAERFGGLESFKMSPQEASIQFHSRISPISDEYFASDNEYTSNEQRFNLEMSYCSEKRPLRSCLSDNKMDSKYRSQNTAQHARHFYKQWTGKDLSDENCACKTRALFLLMGIQPNGEHYQLGYGVADVYWATFSPLQIVSCEWMVNLSPPISLGKCSILIDYSRVARKSFKIKMEYDLPFNDKIAVYETVNDRQSRRVAELRVHSFLKYSSIVEERLGRVINVFKSHWHDIRFWCALQHEANLHKEPNSVRPTNRIGIVPYDVHKYGMDNVQSRISDQKYNFYEPEQAEYPIDTEIHLISSEEENFENKLEVEDNYASQNYDETPNPFLSYRKFSERNYDGLSTSRPTAPPNPFHSYRPYELYRPRVGKALEAEHHMSREDLGIKDAEESNFNQNVLVEDNSKQGYTNHLHAEEIWPVLSENISKLDDKPGRHFRLNYINTADPLDIIESKLYKKLSISKTRNDIPLCNMIWNDEEPENIATHNKQNHYEEIYVVTPSTEIETSSMPKHTVYEDADIHDFEETSRVLNKEESQDSVKVSQESNSKDSTLGKDFIKKSINAKSSSMGFLEIISDYQNDKRTFSKKIIDTSTNHGAASEGQQLVPKSETIFSKRSGQKYPNKIEEKFLNVFEVLTKVKFNVRKILKILREKRKEKNKARNLNKIEI